MADFDIVADLRGPRLSDLSVHVRDVLALNLAVEEEYEVGKVSMGSFDFVPYALSGLAAAMRTPTTGTRATSHVSIPIADDQGHTAVAERDVTLYGPGDVLGIDPGQVVRRYPSPGSTNAEETFHAHIEFDRPELPWAFSAHTPGDRMPAWVALVVLEETEVQWEPAQAGLQPIMQVDAVRLPPLDTAWAWAHAQAADGTTSLGARLSTAYAPVNVSRLLGARVLTQNTNYVACLVPTTDAGARAGLGVGGGTLQPAWTSASGRVRLPVYDRWSFRTAPDGDFARLARRLVAIPAPWEIGRRTLDTSRPGSPLTDLGPNDGGRRQVIRCALYSPAPPPPDAPSETARWSQDRAADLQEALERPAVIEGMTGTDPGNVPLLPIVGPRIYARGQRGTGTIPAGDWFAELNLAPTHRVVAGLGTRVVVKDQEPLMQAAWAQVGDVEKANRALALAELSRHLAGTLHRRLARVDAGRLLQLTRPVAARVSLQGAGLTLAGQTARSATPAAALGGSVRRALRSGGPVTRRLAPTERAAASRLVATDRANRDFARPYTEIDGIRGLSTTAVASLDTGLLARALQMPEARAVTTLDAAVTTLSRSASLATAVSTPSLWKAANSAYSPGGALATKVADRVRSAVPADQPGNEVRTRWIGGLAAGLADSRITRADEFMEVALEMDGHVMRVAQAAGPAVRVPVVAHGPVAARGVGPQMMRGGAARGGIGRVVPRRGVDQPGVAAGLGVTPRSAPAPVVAVTPGMALTPVGISLSPTASGALLGSIIRPEVPAGGLAAAIAAPTRERLDRIRTPQGTALATWLERASSITVDQVRAEIVTLIAGPGALALAGTPVRAPLAVGRTEIMARLDPGRTVVDAMRSRLSLGKVAFDVFAESVIRPIMAAPRFDRPMYQALDAYDREWLVPGLGTLAEAEMVTLLSTNDQFTEAFLVGLSDEMGRELLWRQYPTDSRGTYFHRFWDPTRDELLSPIHRFGPSRLGSHVSVGPPGQSGRAVVVIRGEVVRRYPDLTVMALKQARGPQGELLRTARGNPVLPEVPTPSTAAASLFHAMLPPDIMLAGLDITVDELKAGGWWIVLAEHPQATRFRRLEADLFAHEARFARAGADASTTGATVAAARLAQPVRIAFEAGDFLPTH